MATITQFDEIVEIGGCTQLIAMTSHHDIMQS